MRDTGVMIHLANVLGVGTANVVLLGDHAKIIDELSVEVERLRDELEIVKNNDLKWRGLREQEAEIENLRTQLAERDALQPKMIDLLKRLLDSPHTFRRHICNNEEICELINALSASAE